MGFNKEDIIGLIVIAFLLIVLATTDVRQNQYEEYSKLSETELENLVAKKIIIQDGVSIEYQTEIVEQVMLLKAVSDETLYKLLDNNIEIKVVSHSSSLGDDYVGSFSRGSSIQSIEADSSLATLSMLTELVNNITTYQIVIDYRYIDYALLHEIGHYFYKVDNLENNAELNSLIEQVGTEVIKTELDGSEYFTSYPEFYAEVFKMYFQGTLKNEQLSGYLNKEYGGGEQSSPFLLVWYAPARNTSKY